MKLSELAKEDLEAMSYDDVAELVLRDENRHMKTNELFKKVCELTGLSDEEYLDKLPAFFDLLSTDQRFIMVEKGFWDLKVKHSVKVIVDPDEENDDDIEIEEVEEPAEEEDIYKDEDNDDDLSDDDDDLKDLVIIDDDEEQMS